MVGKCIVSNNLLDSMKKTREDVRYQPTSIPGELCHRSYLYHPFKLVEKVSLKKRYPQYETKLRNSANEPNSTRLNK